MHELRVFLQLRTALKGVVALAVLGGSLALAPPVGAVIPPSLEDEGTEVVADAVLPFDRTVTATPTTPAAWRGARATGHNISFDPGEPTRQVAASLQQELRRNGLALNVECQPDLAMNSYPGPFAQVVTNLIKNAMVHAFPHGKSGSINIEISACGRDDIEIAVSDDGRGMSADLRRQAFNPFFTTRRSQGCIGLGLHIVHNIVVNRLGGRIKLESESGEGTRIRIIVPRIAPEPADPQRATRKRSAV